MSRTNRLGSLLAFAALTLPLCAQVSVLTYHNDNSRSGQNLNETTLNPTNVQSDFGRLFVVPVDDWVAAQPLYVANLNIGGGTHNVVFVATLNNSVYAVDADTPSTLYWQQNYGAPTSFNGLCEDSGYQGDAHHGAGIVSTPVIDANLGNIYFVTKTGTSAGNYALTFYAVNIQTGATVGSTVINPGASDWNPQIQMSRPALAEDPTSNYIYAAIGSTGCKELKYEHGYVVAFNTTTGAQVASFATTAGTKNNGGIWQGGGGLALDVSGNIFFATADGYYDGKTNFGDSFLQLSSATNGLTLEDWFTPDDQLYLFNDDLDLSSTGPVLLPAQVVGPPNLMIGTGKTEEIYSIDRDVGSMGEYNMGSNNVVQDIPAPSYLSGCLNATLGGSQGNTCRNGPPSYFVTDSSNDAYVYFPDDANSSPPSDDFECDVMQYTLSGGLLSTSPTVRTTFGTNCSVGTPSISANGTSNGLIWLTVLKGSSTALHALNAQTLVPVYNSNANATRDSLGRIARFVTPTIANGMVYVGGKTSTGGELVVYGLLSGKKK
jgi:hypothetical protein